MIDPDECPCCHKLESEFDMKSFRKECASMGLNGELVNPGGRQLRFSKTGDIWCQISDYCRWCDSEKIRKFWKKYATT